MKSAKYATFFMGLAIINTINAQADPSPTLRPLSVALMAVGIVIAWYYTFIRQERAK